MDVLKELLMHHLLMRLYDIFDENEVCKKSINQLQGLYLQNRLNFRSTEDIHFLSKYFYGVNHVIQEECIELLSQVYKLSEDFAIKEQEPDINEVKKDIKTSKDEFEKAFRKNNNILATLNKVNNEGKKYSIFTDDKNTNDKTIKLYGLKSDSKITANSEELKILTNYNFIKLFDVLIYSLKMRSFFDEVNMSKLFIDNKELLYIFEKHNEIITEIMNSLVNNNIHQHITNIRDDFIGKKFEFDDETKIIENEKIIEQSKELLDKNIYSLYYYDVLNKYFTKYLFNSTRKIGSKICNVYRDKLKQIIKKPITEYTANFKVIQDYKTAAINNYESIIEDCKTVINTTKEIIDISSAVADVADLVPLTVYNPRSYSS